MKHGIEKLERPQRIEQLQPSETLKKLGLKQNDVLCDIGSGTGIFTVAAAKQTTGKVYAIDVDEELLDFISEKCKDQNIDNVTLICPQDFNYSISTNSVDWALMVTVFHEIENKQKLLAEIYRMLNNNGRMAIIEFHKRETPMGPPLEHRIDEESVLQSCIDNNFVLEKRFDVGNSFYCLVFKKIQQNKEKII